MATTTSGTKPIARALLRAQPDERLVRLIRQGRELAFEEVVRRYRPGLVAFAAAYAPGERAEDVVQESLVSSWRALRDSEAEIRLKPWLYTIVRNRALNARRDARPHQPLDESIDGVRTPPEIALESDELARVVAAVRDLPEAQRSALVRSALEGHTHDQIAAALGTSPGSVRQLIYRGRANVREAVGALIPLPLMLWMLTGGGASTAAIGTIAAGAGAGSAGAGGPLAAGAAIVAVAAASIGAGVVVESSRPDGADSARANTEQSADAAGADRASQTSRGSDGGGRPAGDAADDDGPARSDAVKRRRDRQDERRDQAEDRRDRAADQRDDERDAAEDARDAQADAAEDARDEQADAAEDAADEAADAQEEAAEQAEEAAEEAAEAAEEAAEAAEERSGSSSGSGSSASGTSSSGSSGSSDSSGSSGSGSDD